MKVFQDCDSLAYSHTAHNVKLPSPMMISLQDEDDEDFEKHLRRWLYDRGQLAG